MSFWPFAAPVEAKKAADLLAAVIAAARTPALFSPGRVRDALDGRFGALALVAGLALLRLKSERDLSRRAQIFTDQVFRHLDAGLREDGVGDLAVPRRMHALAGRFYGALAAYEAGLAGDEAALVGALERNLPGLDQAGLVWLAAQVRALHARLGATPAAQLALPEVWRWAGD